MWAQGIIEVLMFHWNRRHLQNVCFNFICFIHILKTTDLCLATTATVVSPMSILPQREAYFAVETGPRRLIDLHQTFSP